MGKYALPHSWMFSNQFLSMKKYDVHDRSYKPTCLLCDGFFWILT